MIERTPLVCGGCLGRSGSSSCRHSDSCYLYEPETDSWKKAGTMSGWKSGVASDYSDPLGGLIMAHHGDPLEAGVNRRVPNIYLLTRFEMKT